MKNYINNIRTTVIKATAFILLVFGSNIAKAQIPANALNADPSAKAISQVPLGSNINGNAVLKFRFTNEATSVNNTGQIPVNAVRLTISFPGKFAYTSANSIPKFAVEDADNGMFGVVHLVNNAIILEGEVVDLLLNVRGTELGSGTVTYNADRTTPVIVANLQTANDNASSTFTTTSISTLPITIALFTANTSNCDAVLKWIVASENNTDRTEVQQSINGIDFTTIYTLKAGSDVGEHSAKLSQSTKISYYRLRVVDKSGAVNYSETRTVKTDCGIANQKLSVVPNIVTGSANVLFTSDEQKGLANVTLQDNFGRVLLKTTININQGVNKISLNTSVLPTDTYYIRITGNDWRSETVKIIKE